MVRVGRKGVAILGSTGSVGTTALQLVRRFRDRFRVTALAAGKRVAELKDQIDEFGPALVSVADACDARELAASFGEDGPKVVCGNEGVCAVATAAGTDVCLSALVGAVGLEPTLAAIDAGIDVALANKEVMVIGGELVRNRARANGVEVLPVDSEHNAIFQALRGREREYVRRLVLTASGGPFREREAASLVTVTRAEALDHPTWRMGDKITIDSATLMNKGFEVVEARWFFDRDPCEIDVVVHPQSIVHSMVEYCDGSTVAIMAVPDMSIPIGYALTYPELLDLGHLPRLDLARMGTMSFFRPDTDKFPCLRLAYDALRAGGTMPAVANAANEIAVDRFLAEEIGFTDIPRLVEAAMNEHEVATYQSVAELIAADRWARAFTSSQADRCCDRR